MKRVGVLLSGCGVHDGSEAQETVLVILALARRGLRPVFLAPDVEQRDVVDHTSGERVADASPRNAMEEAARLSRGAVNALGEISSAGLDALVIPGGAGNVKNLCAPGSGSLGGGELRPEVRGLLDEVAARGAPIAGIGLAEVVMAKHQNRPLGNDPMALRPDEVRIDERRGTLLTPGFIASDDVAEVAEGIERLVDEVARRIGGGGAGGSRMVHASGEKR